MYTCFNIEFKLLLQSFNANIVIDISRVYGKLEQETLNNMTAFEQQHVSIKPVQSAAS